MQVVSRCYCLECEAEKSIFLPLDEVPLLSSLCVAGSYYAYTRAKTCKSKSLTVDCLSPVAPLLSTGSALCSPDCAPQSSTGLLTSLLEVPPSPQPGSISHTFTHAKPEPPTVALLLYSDTLHITYANGQDFGNN